MTHLCQRAQTVHPRRTPPIQRFPEATTRAAKRPKMVLPTDAPDEVLVASVSYVQHAMIGTTNNWCPYYQGRHYQAACGARLDPDWARFAQSADQGLHLCQRPACVKAWKAMLV